MTYIAQSHWAFYWRNFHILEEVGILKQSFLCYILVKPAPIIHLASSEILSAQLQDNTGAPN